MATTAGLVVTLSDGRSVDGWAAELITRILARADEINAVRSGRLEANFGDGKVVVSLQQWWRD